MTDFFSIFQPGMQHVREQRDLEKVFFVESPDGAPGGPQLIDFESGRVTIVVPPKDDDPEPDASEGDK
ncbi:DUF6191 domain-containing protein [Tessaracoccus sp. OS52]|uniref:DUF6191 domain-containing protein n=1 Tax=Tessaracoccus sp. OS52 TaxID=2886691 RepID=UPI001D111E07|nr:DUF6191 domain-containing protein [Tessaracoccus sp. OS52]MCC2593542.1 DUF6191 domain-containing protein [Tessaracoccus sp. OS52]